MWVGFSGGKKGRKMQQSGGKHGPRCTARQSRASVGQVVGVPGDAEGAGRADDVWSLKRNMSGGRAGL